MHLVLPILWRHMLAQYLKVLAICVLAFLGVLLTTRLDEIARFATLGAEIRYVFLFALHQIPYILPIVIPISCLISSVILFQQMSQSQEITALRGCGLALSQIIGPVLFAGALMSLCNFYVISEWATQSHLAARQLHNELKSINPLVLLQNSQFLRLKGIYASIQGPVVPGESMADVVVATKNAHEQRIQLLLGKKLESSAVQLNGENMSLIASRDAGVVDDFDHLIIQNVSQVSMPIQDIAHILKKEGWRLSVDHLKLPLLMVRTRGAQHMLRQSLADGKSIAEIANYRCELNKCRAEFSRRLSVSLAAFAFTLMGASFGMGVGRRASRRGTLYVTGLATLYLVCFFCAKSLDYLFVASTLLYTLPLIIILLFSLHNLRSLSKGVE